MFKKVLSNLILSLTVVIFLMSCSQGTSKKLTINFSHTMAPNSLSDIAANKFKELVEAGSDNTIRVNVVPNCGLSGGDLTKAIEMVSTGDIDIHASSPNNLANFDNRYYIFWMPFMFTTEESIYRICSNEKIKNEVGSWSSNMGISLLGFHNAGARQISNNKKIIRTPDDLKGMNIRVPGATIFIDLYRDYFFANPTAMDFSEVYTALQQKTIDGQENPISVFDSSKFNEVQKYLTLWDYVRDITGWFISDKTLNKLNEEQKILLERCANESLNFANEYIKQSEIDILQKIEKENVVVTRLTSEEKKAFQNISEPIYTKYQDIIGKEVISLFRSVANGE